MGLDLVLLGREDGGVGLGAGPVGGGGRDDHLLLEAGALGLELVQLGLLGLDLEGGVGQRRGRGGTNTTGTHRGGGTGAHAAAHPYEVGR